MTTPAWLAATPGYPAQAGQVNQFLITHQAQYVYAGVEQASEQVGGTVNETSDGLWIAQSFTASAGQTTFGYVMVWGFVTGQPDPWAFSLQADNGSGAPSGVPLVTTQMPKEAFPASGDWVTVLLPLTGLTPGDVYWIVAEAQGDASDYYSWLQSNQTSGASTSPDGSTWTAQTYGLLYQVFDGTATGLITGIFEDARWTQFAYTASVLTGIQEWTTGQSPAGYAWSSRTLSYSSGLLTEVV